MTYDEAKKMDREVWADKATSQILLSRLQDELRRARIEELRRAPVVLGQGDYERHITADDMHRAGAIGRACWFVTGLVVGMLLMTILSH